MTMTSPDDDSIHEMMPPDQVIVQLRQLIHICWIILPAEERTLELVEARFRKLVDRAVEEFRHDAEFSKGG